MSFFTAIYFMSLIHYIQLSFYVFMRYNNCNVEAIKVRIFYSGYLEITKETSDQVQLTVKGSSNRTLLRFEEP